MVRPSDSGATVIDSCFNNGISLEIIRRCAGRQATQSLSVGEKEGTGALIRKMGEAEDRPVLALSSWSLVNSAQTIQFDDLPVIVC